LLETDPTLRLADCWVTEGELQRINQIREEINTVSLFRGGLGLFARPAPIPKTEQNTLARELALS